MAMQDFIIPGTSFITSIFGLLTALLLWFGTFIFVVGFSTTGWGYVNLENQYQVYYGLWKYCDTYNTRCTSMVGNEGVSGKYIIAVFRGTRRHVL